MSVKKDKYTWGLIAAVLLLVALAIGAIVAPFLESRISLRLGDGVFQASLAQTEAERAKGLSGVTQLAPTRAMLFVFDTDDVHGIWMKGMHVPVDIVWLDNDKTVVYILHDVSPDTYPQTFTPEKPARYVVELPAGTVASRNIRIGTVAVFDLDEPRGIW